MRIYSRSEFMKLPEGTIFSSGERFAFNDLHVKGETWSVDFLQSSLIDIESFSSEENAERLYEMDEKFTSYPIRKTYGREGLFDENMVYLVYEKSDLQYLIELIQESLKIIPT